jgi:hypothetical protein
VLHIRATIVTCLVSTPNCTAISQPAGGFGVKPSIVHTFSPSKHHLHASCAKPGHLDGGTVLCGVGCQAILQLPRHQWLRMPDFDHEGGNNTMARTSRLLLQVT